MRLARRQLASSALVVVLAIALAACGSSGSKSASPPTPSAGNHPTAAKLHLINSGVLTVGSDTSYPPMESRDPSSGQYVGADVDLASALAKQMGLSSAKIVNAAFDSLIPSLASNRFDVIMSSMNDTPERAKKVSFVDYMTASEGILVNKGSGIHAKDYSALCGKNVAVERGTTELDGLNAANKKCSSPIHILSFTDDSAAFQAFAAGHSDAYTSDLPVIANYVKKYGSKYEQAGPAISAGENYGIAVSKSNPSLLAALKKALSQIRSNGTYDKILKKWGVADAALK